MFRFSIPKIEILCNIRHQKTLAQIFCSRGRPVELLLDVLQILLDVQQDSTGRPLEFCKFASNVLEMLISSRNAIKISTGRPVELLLDIHQILLDVHQNFASLLQMSQDCQFYREMQEKFLLDVKQNFYWTSPRIYKTSTRAEDLAEYISICFNIWEYSRTGIFLFHGIFHGAIQALCMKCLICWQCKIFPSCN